MNTQDSFGKFLKSGIAERGSLLQTSSPWAPSPCNGSPDTMSRDRKHGDPFPLPLVDQKFIDQHMPDFVSPWRLQLANEAVKSANALAGAHMKATRALHSIHAPRTQRPRTAVQIEMTLDILKRLDTLPPPETGCNEEQCLRDLTGASYLYGEANHLASYDPDRIKIFRRRLNPLDARSLCPPEVRRQLELFPQFIERTEDEISDLYPDGLGVEPYWDPALRKNRKLREDLYVRLWNTGLLTFRRKRKALIAFFVVKKKDGMQRLVCDARQANRCHRPPPTTQLSTPSCFSAIDLSDYNLMEQGFGEIFGLHDSDGDSPVFSCRGNEGDVGDCFYNFSIEELSSWFATKDQFSTERLSQLGICPSTIFDDDRQDFDKVVPGEYLIPCFRGVCMGWSWALHLAQSIVSHQVSLPVQGYTADLILDRKVAPDPTPSHPVIGTYVDNVQVLGGNAISVDDRMRGIVEQFKSLGIPFVTSSDESLQQFETLGLVFDLEHRCIRHRHSRSWRLYYATKCLLKRGRIRGETLRIWLGHVVHHFQLCRPAMSAVHSCYRFVSAALGKRMEVWPSVRFEMRIVFGLIFQGFADLALPYSEVAYLGDSSTYGYSLMVTECSEKESKKAMRSQERWRFLEAEVYVPGGAFSHESAAPAGQAAITGAVGPSTKWGQMQTHENFEAFVTKKKQVHMNRDAHLPSHGTVVIDVPSLCESLDPAWKKISRYKLIVARAWKYKTEHINLKEARVCLLGLRRQCRTLSGLRKRLLTISDNLSCVLAFNKGRSNSYAMNQLVRRSAAYCIFGGIKWHLRHIRSEDNAADDSSRWHDPSSMAKWKREEARRQFEADLKHTFKMKSQAERDRELHPQRVQLDRPADMCTNDCADLNSHIPTPRIAYLPLFFLEVFAGSGRLTSSMASHGFTCLSPFEIYDGMEYDITRPSTQAFLMGLIQAGLVWYIHFGLPCTCWSRARQSTKNLVRAQAREMVSLELTLFTVALCIEQVRRGRFFSIENPANSRLFEFRPVLELLGMYKVFMVTWDSCSYGTIYKKPTSLISNMTSLQQLACRCTRDHSHVPVVGSEQYFGLGGGYRTRNRTVGAGEYPWALTDAWANLAGQHAPEASRLPDYSDFNSVVTKRLQEIAGHKPPKQRSPRQDRPTRLDIHFGNEPRPLYRARAYRRPIIFGQRTKEEIAFLRSQGA